MPRTIRIYAKMVADIEVPDSIPLVPDLEDHLRGAPPSFNNGMRDRIQNAWRAALTSYPGATKPTILEWHYHIGEQQTVDGVVPHIVMDIMDALPIDQPGP